MPGSNPGANSFAFKVNVCHLLLVFLSVSLLASPVFAQRGEISGQVLDQAGG
jgi:hypothetical protein